FLSCIASHLLLLLSFPTRRSSELETIVPVDWLGRQRNRAWCVLEQRARKIAEQPLFQCVFLRKAQQDQVMLVHLRKQSIQGISRSEELTSELQSRENLVCGLLVVK